MSSAKLFRLLVPGLLATALSLAGLQAASLPDVPGVHNFHQVDEHVYRGAQPDGGSFAGLAKIGIKTVIDLRGERWEQSAVENAGMRYVRMPWSGYKAPADWQIATVLSLLNDKSAWPVFIHCKRGADRTGTAIACYRIAHDGWTSQHALEEAKTFGMSPMETAMQRFILRFDPLALTTTAPAAANTASALVPPQAAAPLP
jgi:protein tyrosine/serine phosphatase